MGTGPRSSGSHVYNSQSNLAQHGTGALNIDACRLSGDGLHEVTQGGNRSQAFGMKASTYDVPSGRWPANVVLDADAAVMLDEQSGTLTSGTSDGFEGQRTDSVAYGKYARNTIRPNTVHGDSGGASRFYYVAKPSREERDYGIYDLDGKSAGEATERKDGSAGLNSPRAGAGRTGGARNFHPTVKPVELMRWLVKLVTPIGGTVLDPFGGSGTTAMACRYEQRPYILIEREAEYVEIIKRRVSAVAPLFGEIA